MRRWPIVLALSAIAALAPLATAPSNTHAGFRPAFLEADRGIDPVTSTCRQTGRTAVQTANVNVIAGDGLVQLGQAAGCFTPQNEPALAVAPNDPAFLVAGSNDYRLCCDRTGHNDGTGWAYVSHDGGKTWLNRLLPMLTVQTGGQGFLAHVESAGDPAVAVTESGVVVYANIAFSRTDAHSAIVLSRSTDGGRHWRNPQLLARANDATVFLDKEAVAAGPHHLVAVTWTRFAGGGIFGTARIYAAVSHDDGLHFGKPVEVAPGYGISQGSAPAFAPDGTLYVGYETADLQFGVDVEAYSVARTNPSRNLRFVVHVVAPAWDGCYPANSDGRGTLTGLDFRITSFPSLAVDPSTGSAALAWTDDEAGCGQPVTDSQLHVSFLHQGRHSDPVTVTAGADKTMPAAAYRNGVLTVGFYTRSYATDAASVDYAYVSSSDGYVEHRLSDGSSDTYTEFRGQFIGDYTAAAAGSDGVVHFVWTDSRGGDQNIFTATTQR